MSAISAPGNLLPTPRPTETTAAVREQSEKLARDFEGLFGSMLVKELRQTLEQKMLFGSDSGDVYGGLFDRFFGEHLTSGQGLGMQPMIERSLGRLHAAGQPLPEAPQISVSM